MSSKPTRADVQTASLSGRLKLAVRRPDARKPKISELAQSFAVVGRAPECDLSLTSPDVSFRHAYVQQIGSGLFCVDLGSRTGLHWKDGQRHWGWLTQGETVQIGPFACGPAEKSAASSRMVPPESFNPLDQYQGQLGALPAVEVEFMNGSPSKPIWRISRMITLVGSSRRCKFRLEDESVSTFHCSLVLAADGLWVVDLLGKGGTRVGRTTTRCALLKDGQKIRVGKFLMRIHYRNNGPAPGSEPVVATINEDEIGPAAAILEEAEQEVALPQTSVGLPALVGAASDTDTDLPQPNIAEEWQRIASQQQSLDEAISVLEEERRNMDRQAAALVEREQALEQARVGVEAARLAVQTREESLASREQKLLEREQYLFEREDEATGFYQRLESEKSALDAREAELAAAEHLRLSHLRELAEQEEQLKSDATILDEKVTRFESQRREFAAECEDLSKVRAEIAEKRQALETLQASLALEKTRIAEARRQAELQANEFTLTESALFKQRELIVREREALAVEKGRWRAEVAASRQQVENIAREDSALVDRRAEVDRKLAELERQRVAVDADQRDLVQERERLHSEQRHFYREKSQIEQNLAELYATHQAREASLSELEQQLNGQRNDIAEDRKTLAAERLAMASERESQSAQADELLAESRSLERQRKEIAARAEELAEERAALKAQLEEITEGRNKVESARQWLREKRASILAARAELQRERAELDSEEKTPVVELEFVDPLPPNPLELTLHNQVFKTERDGSTLIVTPQGDSGDFHYRLVQTEANKVRRLVDGATFRNVIVDFSAAPQFGTVIMSVVVMLARQASDRKGRAALCAASSDTLQTLESMKLIDLWPYFPVRGEALSWLKGEPE
ncbi:MAG: FHA domain-containing protein [Planctomycetaceae bacterium]